VTAGAVHVRLQVGDETYAVPIKNVLEVAELGALTMVPGAGPSLLGLSNFHGQVLPVFDFAHVLGASHDSQPSRLLVAEQGGRLAGLAVDGVTDVVPIAGELEQAESDYLTHAVLEDGRLVGVVDIDRIFTTLAKEAS
jgi:purine-binding chemotaxis protein CheW